MHCTTAASLEMSDEPKFLFLICFFWLFGLSASVDNQHFTNNQQIIKKKIMMVVGACIFLVAAAQALPLFFGL